MTRSPTKASTVVKAAFIEYTNEGSAANAKDTLQGFKVTPTTQLKITFAKK